MRPALALAVVVIVGCNDSGSTTGGGGSEDAAAPDASAADATAADAAPADDLDGARPPLDGGRSDAGASPIDAMVGPDAVVGADPDRCRLPYNGGSGVGVGFPRPPYRLHTEGVVRAKLIFVEFADVTSDTTPEAVFDILSPGAERYFDDVSYGRMELVLDPHLAWLPLSRTAAHYAAGLRSFQGHREFIAEAVAVADAETDFSATDVVVVMSTPNAAEVAFGPTWMGVPGWAIEADGNAITNAITSGADLLFWGSLWLNHELGHSMSLPDLYDFESPNGFTRPYSVMDLINAEAPELLAWERWQLGWLDDAQIVCEPGSAEVRLTPLGTPGGRKAVMVRATDTRVITVESRRATGYDERLNPGGAVVSLVDSEIATGHGPIRVLNGQGAMLPGDSVTVDGVTIEVVSASPEGDTVRVTVE